jgi:hypothetical protein
MRWVQGSHLAAGSAIEAATAAVVAALVAAVDIILFVTFDVSE